MFKQLLYFTLFYVFCFMKWSESYKITIDKMLEDGKKLPKTKWTIIQVEDVSPDEPEGLVSLNVDVPQDLLELNPSIYVFFANSDHKILRINVDKKLRAIFYKRPYQVKWKAKNLNLATCPITPGEESYDFCIQFPKTWMPQNCSKINAALELPNGIIHNLYGIRNYRISLPDLMVVEEYKNHICL